MQEHIHKRSWKAVLIVALILLATQPALAHVTINPSQAPADSYFKADFRVPHGCAGFATVKIGVQIPEGVTSVAPQVASGWEIDIVKEQLAEPMEDSHGNVITERVSEIWWHGGYLPDAHMQEFGLSMRLPDRPNETIYFPIVQVCEEGEHHWIEVPVDGQSRFELDEPAPALLLVDDSTAVAGPAAETVSTPPTTGTASGPDGWTAGALVLGLLGTVMGGLNLRRRS